MAVVSDFYAIPAIQVKFSAESLCGMISSNNLTEKKFRIPG